MEGPVPPINPPLAPLTLNLWLELGYEGRKEEIIVCIKEPGYKDEGKPSKI